MAVVVEAQSRQHGFGARQIDESMPEIGGPSYLMVENTRNLKQLMNQMMRIPRNSTRCLRDLPVPDRVAGVVKVKTTCYSESVSIEDTGTARTQPPAKFKSFTNEYAIIRPHNRGQFALLLTSRRNRLVLSVSSSNDLPSAPPNDDADAFWWVAIDSEGALLGYGPMRTSKARDRNWNKGECREVEMEGKLPEGASQVVCGFDYVPAVRGSTWSLGDLELGIDSDLAEQYVSNILTLGIEDVESSDSKR